MAVIAQQGDYAARKVHYERFDVPPEPKPFLEVSDEHRENWERLVEHCTPVDTQTPLTENCRSLAEKYFFDEPVWAYGNMYYYDWSDGWTRIYVRGLGGRTNHSFADFINDDVPMWRDIFDGQITQRQERFEQVVSDESCKDLVNRNTPGIQETKAQLCAARELYKFATYLSACDDAQSRLTFLHKSIPMESGFDSQNHYELSFEGLDKWVPDTALRISAKRRLEKAYLHARWVEGQCKRDSDLLSPGLSEGIFSSEEIKRRFGFATDENVAVLRRTHNQALTIAAKSGDDWALRSYSFGSFTSEINHDVMKKYPLLMYRTLGDGSGYDFTRLDEARFRAKAYLLLVDQGGEELAQREYDPNRLKNEIRYVKRGGLLKPLPTHAEVLEARRKRLQQMIEDDLLKEAEHELL